MRTAGTLIIFLLMIGFQRCGNTPVSKDTPGNTSDTGKAVLIFREYEHHFGVVEEGEKISYLFMYENKGTAPLAIASVTTTCGCTVPKYNKKPVKPGEKGSLEVIFDTSGRSGMQTKTITVRSNAEVPVVILKITAEIEQE